MEDDFSPLDNTLVNNDIKKKTYIGSKPKIEHFINKFKVDDDDKGLIMYMEKIMVSRNGEWAYDTYIRANKTIDEKAVKKYISKLDKDYEVMDISYEFHGGVPMGTLMLDYNEIQGDNVWVVNLKPKLYEFLKREGKVGNIEDLYEQVGGEKHRLLPTDTYISRIGKIIGNELDTINSIVIDTINGVFFVEENDKEMDPVFYKSIKQIK